MAKLIFVAVWKLISELTLELALQLHFIFNSLFTFTTRLLNTTSSYLHRALQANTDLDHVDVVERRIAIAIAVDSEGAVAFSNWGNRFVTGFQYCS